MKKKDYDLLKSVCEKEGFQLLNLDHEDNENYYVIAKKKDAWEGVEFGKVADDYLETDYIAGKIYPVTGFGNGFVDTLFDEDGDIDNGLGFKFIEPSTKEAYVEQLKNEMTERFGEIKKGDKFLDWDDVKFSVSTLDFDYNKNKDILFFGGWAIYRKGKWVERVKERVKVEPTKESINRLAKDLNENEKSEVLALFASQLEKYLNHEI
jgi:hypothetical protein